MLPRIVDKIVAESPKQESLRAFKNKMVSQDVKELRESAKDMLKTMEENEMTAEKARKDKYAKENQEVQEQADKEHRQEREKEE